MNIQNVLIVGRGAVGSLYGSILFENMKEGKMAYVVDEERKQKYTADAITINNKPIAFEYITSLDVWPKADLVLFFTKYGSLSQAMEQAAPFIDEHTILMAGINGICSEDDLRRRFPDSTTLRCIAQKMDSLYVNNTTTYSQKGELVFGADGSGQQEAVEDVRQCFEACGIPHRLSEQIVKDQWNKLMVNCGLNQIAGAFHATYGMIHNDPKYSKMFKEAMEEVRQTALAYGIEISKEDRDAWVEDLETFNPDSMPSMLQDVLACRKTEEQLFSKTVVPLAKAKGIETPVLEMLMEKIEEYENSLE